MTRFGRKRQDRRFHGSNLCTADTDKIGLPVLCHVIRESVLSCAAADDVGLVAHHQRDLLMNAKILPHLVNVKVNLY